MARRVAYEYVENGTWKEIVTTDDIRVESKPLTSTTNNEESKLSTLGQAPNNSRTQKEVESKFKKQELFILVGDISLAVPILSLKIGNVINLQGVGNNLSGNYTIEAIRYTITNSAGLSQVITVSRNAFGSSIMKNGVKKPNDLTLDTPFRKEKIK